MKPSLHAFGPCLKGDELSFTFFSNSAKAVVLHLFKPHEEDSFATHNLTRTKEGIWTTKIPPIDPSIEYLFEVDSNFVLDPYAKALSSPHIWGSHPRRIRCQFTFDHSFDWEGVEKPHLRKEELIIYEMHVRSFTRHPTSHVPHPGTFLGIIEKLPYLKDLGVNAIELLPIHEFEEWDNPRKEPLSGKPLPNVWGYMTKNFFCPMKRYATSEERLAPLTEFKTFVKACHREGIEVLLDVVYNHVSPHSDLEKIDKESYFILNPKKEHTNFSGCGNTLSLNTFAGAHLTFSSLHYFAEECHVDGFRFDLAGCFARNEKGYPLQAPPFFKQLSEDPILSSLKLIVEPWDALGFHLLPDFSLPNFSFWNASFKTAIRRFVRGDGMQEQFFKDSFLGSSYLFSHPSSSINYVTSHDGFSLNDLVSYNSKHNLSNGENNKDGDSDNVSSNCGVEGATDISLIQSLRTLRMKNFLFANLLSIGIPMLRMGDEYGHSNLGNNNIYCQDRLSWFQWNQKPLLAPFIKTLIHLRNSLPFYKSSEYLNDVEVHLHAHTVVCIVEKTYLIACNMSEKPLLLPSGFKPLLATSPLESDFLSPQSFLIASKI